MLGAVSQTRVSGGNRTHDPHANRLAYYPLNYQGTQLPQHIVEKVTKFVLNGIRKVFLISLHIKMQFFFVLFLIYKYINYIYIFILKIILFIILLLLLIIIKIFMLNLKRKKN